MSELADRLTRYFLARLRRLQWLDHLEAATAASLLEAIPLVQGSPEFGLSWKASEKGIQLVHSILNSRTQLLPSGIAEDRLEALTSALSRALAPVFAKKAMTRKERRFYSNSDYADFSDPTVLDILVPGDDAKPNAGETQILLRAISALVPPPSPSAVATVLLLARSVGEVFPFPADFTTALAGEAKVSRFHAGVPGFERHFGELLEEGVILPQWSLGVDAAEHGGLTSDRSHRRHGKSRRHVLTLSGTSLDDAIHPKSREKIDRALRGSPTPLFLVDERVDGEDSWLSAITDLSFECGMIDRQLLIDVMVHAMDLNSDDATDTMDEIEPEVTGAGLDDIAIAFRPGRSPAHMLKALEALARSRVADEDKAVGKDGKSAKGSAGKKAGLSPSLTIIQPEPIASHGNDVADRPPSSDALKSKGSGELSQSGNPTGIVAGTSTKKPILAVETLAGFGPARSWALNLKADLELWRSGLLPWSEISSRLLLSGPPGTGKTTYARALCNSLQVPLISTSVGDWLEPGYLGDVLQLMTGSFKLAEQHAPAILFIDEIDNIGTRGSSSSQGRFDEYWASLVNRMLTLLDGVVKTEGVIVVGATNRLDKIDSALLRSGRLETQVAIELPDVPALTQILRHHLGSDLDAVLASAPPLPSPLVKTVEKPTKASPEAKSSPSSNRDMDKGVRA